MVEPSNRTSSGLLTTLLAPVRVILSIWLSLVMKCVAAGNAIRSHLAIITKQKMKVTRSSIRRKSIKMIGLPLADQLGKLEFKKSNLEGPKQVFLPKSGFHMNYYERKAVNGQNTVDPTKQPTLVFFHGFSSSAREFFAFLTLLDIPDNVRILIPEQLGHGQDLKRAFQEGEAFQQPNADMMVDSTSEFLDVMKAGTNCNALGTSFGGVLLYYLRMKRPDVIQKTVLVSPALAKCLADPFLDGLIDGSENFVDFQSRDDVVHLFRDLLWTDPKRRSTNSDVKKDPFPKFIYDFMYEMNMRDVPRGHNKGLQDSLIKAVTQSKGGDGIDDIYLAPSDIDKDSLRLVVWPEEDQICDHKKGKRFFESSGATVFESVPECGHVFHENGKGIYELLAPKVQEFLLDFSTRNLAEVRSRVQEVSQSTPVADSIDGRVLLDSH